MKSFECHIVRPDVAPYWMCPRLSIAGLVVAAHVLCANPFNHLGSRQQFWHASVPVESFAIAQIIIQSSSNGDKVPAPLVNLESVPVDSVPPMSMQFDEVDDAQLTDDMGPASFPHLARIQSVDVGDVARRAGIVLDRPLTVVLSVQVNTEGAAIAIDILRSCGVDAADQAAIDYALLVRWVPGTVNREPRTMRVILPVTLDAARIS